MFISCNCILLDTVQDVRYSAKMTSVKIRQVTPDDKAEWLRMRIALWTRHKPKELEQELDKLLAN